MSNFTKQRECNTRIQICGCDAADLFIESPNFRARSKRRRSHSRLSHRLSRDFHTPRLSAFARLTRRLARPRHRQLHIGEYTDLTATTTCDMTRLTLLAGMTRHRVLNPKTGRYVFATGSLGQAIRKKEKKKEKAKKEKAKKEKKTKVKNVKTACEVKKAAAGGVYISARYLFNKKGRKALGSLQYFEAEGCWKEMALRNTKDGSFSPYWKPLKL